jgi:peptide/nickel transport system permease protein
MKRASLVVGSLLVGVLLITAIVSMFWTPHDPIQVVAADRLQGPSAAHLLGTDMMGIDLLSRLMVGARDCFQSGITAVFVAVAVGVPLGVLSAMASGWLSEVLLRITSVLYAFPILLLAILFAAVAGGGSTWTAMLAIGIATVPIFARVSRAAALPVLASDYVLAARSAGTSQLSIALRHVLPNIASVIWVQASISFGVAVLAGSGISYLGLGSPAPTVTWGRMLYEAQSYLYDYPMLALLPGIAIALAILGFNLLGDGLRDLLDPRLREIA